MNSFNFLPRNSTAETQNCISAEPIYGYPLLEEDPFDELFPLETSAEFVPVVPTVEVTCYPATMEEAGTVPTIYNAQSEAFEVPCYPATVEHVMYDSASAEAACYQATVQEYSNIVYDPENSKLYDGLTCYPTVEEAGVSDDFDAELFDGIIEILGEENEPNDLAFAVLSEGDNADFVFSDTEMVYQAYSYAVPEATVVDHSNDDKKFYSYDDDFAVDCVAAFESMDMSGDEFETPVNAVVAEDCKVRSEENHINNSSNNELFKVGNIDVDYLKSLHDAEEKRQRRKEAINRWKLKKNKRAIQKAVLSGVSAVSDAVNSAAAALQCSSVLNARQKATAQRKRENGKFKKAQVKWVSVTELFGGSSYQEEDFK
jgi:hypothetical protein